ncbi:NAD(P)H-dependent oxidoreductase [Rhodococcoides yunnanense]|uniref:NAD(P)H-dependent oxidoreductase n=1 Tax=Rhodococcoides yunnanense TaxID=278209 RepID=UPI0009321EB4|nr:NAD(P)H-dependent oxidoreductase [Rhodococcus yunnanensis]
MSQAHVLVLVGSLRADSVNKQIADTAASLAPEGSTALVYSTAALAEVAFYNEDIDVDGKVPAAALALRAEAEKATAFLLVTPEYNGTIPAVLKNAIDWLSRPYGSGAVSSKPVAVISASPSGNGAKWAHDDARKAVGIAGGKVLKDVELAIGGTIDKFGTAHPSENSEVSAQISSVVAELVKASNELVSA